MSQPESIMPLSDALCVAALELADLARLSGQIETIISGLVARAGEAAPELLAECQVADLLSQRLVGAAAFLAALANAAPSDASVDVLHAVSKITLADQARRLSGRRAAAAPHCGDGELALFED